MSQLKLNKSYVKKKFKLLRDEEDSNDEVYVEEFQWGIPISTSSVTQVTKELKPIQAEKEILTEATKNDRHAVPIRCQIPLPQILPHVHPVLNAYQII